MKKKPLSGGMFSYSLLIPPLLLLLFIFLTSTAGGDDEVAVSTATAPSILLADGTCSSSTCGDDANSEDGGVSFHGSSSSTLEEEDEEFVTTDDDFTTSIDTTTFTPPLNWKQMTFSELRDYFDCSEHAYDLNKALPTLDEWMVLQHQYRELVDSEPLALRSSVVPPTLGYSHGSSSSSSDNSSSSSVNDNIIDHDIPPPYYASQSEGKGRGLFSSRPIRKGELVQNGPRSSFIFPNATAFRRLVVNLPRMTACDVTEWAWTQQLSNDDDDDDGDEEQDEKMWILLDLNIAALMNSSDEPNVAPRSNRHTKFYALRDIDVDEEILQDYSLYNVDWVAVGLGD
jgi:hypothetical protein